MARLLSLIILFISIIFTILSVEIVDGQYITTNEVDAFTNTVRIEATLIDEGDRLRSRDFVDENNSIFPSVSFVKTEDGNEAFLFSLLVRNLRGCLSQHSTRIMFLLENSETITLGQLSRTDCNSSSKSGTFVLGYDEPAFDDDDRFDENTSTDNGYYIPSLLTEKRIDQIRVYGSEGYRDYVIKDDKKDAIKNMIKLLLSNIPSD